MYKQNATVLFKKNYQLNMALRQFAAGNTSPSLTPLVKSLSQATLLLPPRFFASRPLPAALLSRRLLRPRRTRHIPIAPVARSLPARILYSNHPSSPRRPVPPLKATQVPNHATREGHDPVQIAAITTRPSLPSSIYSRRGGGQWLFRSASSRAWLPQPAG